MTLITLNRWKAATLHLGISAAIAATVVALMLALWYPKPYFEAMGGDTLIMILIGVDVVIGPLITLVIFDPKKKKLKFDLAVIAALMPRWKVAAFQRLSVVRVMRCVVHPIRIGAQF